MIRTSSLVTLLCIGAAVSAQQPRLDGPTAGAINAVLGDASFARAFGDARSAHLAGENLRITTHLDYVLALVQARPVDDLSVELQQARAENIAQLQHYRADEVFPRNYDHSDRTPCFIDRDGRICAVGYLVEQTAGRELAEAINAKYQYALLADMEDEALDAWAARSGLTKRELAMIQPAYGGCGVFGPCATTTRYGTSCPAPDPVPAVATGFGAITHELGDESHGQFVYATTFDLSGFDPITASISGQWASDSFTTMLLNGSAIGGAATAILSPFSITSGFVAGINTLEIRVQSFLSPFQPGFVGMQITGISGTADQNGSPAPIPGLFDTGVDDQGSLLPIGAQDPHWLFMNPPTLTANSLPTLGNTGFAIESTAGPAFAQTTLLCSLVPDSIPLGNGCDLLIDVTTFVAALPGQADANGTTSFALPINNDPSLLGFGLSTQGVAIDPNGPFFGLSLTNGVTLLVGAAGTTS